MEWAGMYVAGVVVCAFTAIDGGEKVYVEGKTWPTVVGVILWPLLLPWSFLALWINLCYLGLKLGLWVAEVARCDVQFPEPLTGTRPRGQ